MDIKLINVTKKYKSTDEMFISSLELINIDINYGNYISFVGPSGSGKTTLLKIITGNLKPTSGDVFWGKFSIMKNTEKKVFMLRKKVFGIVFQDTNFINELNVEDNIFLPLVINYIDIAEKRKYFNTLVENLNINKLKKRYPYELSGGEKKKVAIARALMNSPEILIADEPTANLDEYSAREVFNIFSNLNKMGLTIIIATHDVRFGAYCKETYYLQKGKIERFMSKDIS
jgi:putative ABC transport system ATP-binding protein